MAKGKEVQVPEIIDSVDALIAKMNAMREAQKVFATYTQEQVDKIFFEAAKAAEQDGVRLIYGMDGIPDGIYIDTPENRELIRKGLGLYPDYRNWRDDFDPSFVAELDVMQ